MQDPKPEKRVVSKGVARAILDAERSCRVCGRSSDHAHHLVRRSQRGDDVIDNLIALCARCHRYYHDGDQEVAQQIRRKLSRPERDYILNKKGRAWFDKVYPYDLGSEDPDKLGPSAAYAASESAAPAPPDSSSGQEHSPATDPGTPFPHGSDGGGKPCKRCAGSGHEPPKPDAPAKKQGPKTITWGFKVAYSKAEYDGPEEFVQLYEDTSDHLGATGKKFEKRKVVEACLQNALADPNLKDALA